MNGNAVIMPVPLKLGKAFVCSLRDKLVSWPLDGRPEGDRTYLKHYSCSKINKGAVQCALCCTTCRIGAWQATHRGMLNHYRAHHDSVCQLSLKEANVSGEENVVVVESCWCIKGIDGDGNASAVQQGSWTPCKRQRV